MQIAVLLLLAVLPAQDLDQIKPPAIGRPATFSGAIGKFLSIEVSAKATDVYLGNEIDIAITIWADGAARWDPAKWLNRLPETDKRFHWNIALSETLARSVPAQETGWSFSGSVRPIAANVKEIPAIRFDYFAPGFQPPEKGYQTRYSEPIPIRVTTTPAALPELMVGPPPHTVVSIVKGRQILRHDSPRTLSWMNFLLVAVGIPVVIVSVVAFRSAGVRTAAVAFPLIWIATASNSDEIDAGVLHSAEDAFHKGLGIGTSRADARSQFGRAAHEYECLRHKGYRCVELFRNEGNSWLLAGDLARAILAYRLAQEMDWSDAATFDNLQYARSLRDGKAAKLNRSDRIILAVDWLVVAAAIVYAILCTSLARVWIERRRGVTIPACLLVVFGVLVTAGYSYVEQSINRLNSETIVVINAIDVAPRSGDGALYPAVGSDFLQPGVELRLLFAGKAWLQVELPEGAVGWIMRDQALMANSE